MIVTTQGKRKRKNFSGVQTCVHIYMGPNLEKSPLLSLRSQNFNLGMPQGPGTHYWDESLFKSSLPCVKNDRGDATSDPPGSGVSAAEGSQKTDQREMR